MDQLELSKVSERFEECSRKASVRTGINLNIPKFTKKDAVDVFRTFGSAAKSVVVNMKMFPEKFTPGSTLSRINEWCPKIESIQLVDFILCEWPHVYSDSDSECESDSYSYTSYTDYSGYNYECKRHLWTNDESCTLRPPNVKRVTIKGGCLYVGAPLFYFWATCTETLTIKNLKVSDDIFKCIHKLFNKNESKSKPYVQLWRTFLNHNIEQAIFSQKNEDVEDDNVQEIAGNEPTEIVEELVEETDEEIVDETDEEIVEEIDVGTNDVNV